MAGTKSKIVEGSARLVAHLSDPLYRTTYLLSAGAGITALLGLVFWVLAAHRYSPHVVGVNSAVISAMMFLANACQLGLPNVLLRDLPTAGGRARWLISRSYVVMFVVTLVFAIAAAFTGQVWSSSLGFLSRDPEWILGFGFGAAFFAIFQGQDSVLTALDAPTWVPLENSLFSLGKLVLLVAIAGVAPFAGPYIAWTVPAVVMAVFITWLIFRRLVRRPGRVTPMRVFNPRRFVQMAFANQIALLFSYTVLLLMPVIVASETNPTTTAYFYVPWTIVNGVTLLGLNSATALTREATLHEQQLGRLLRRALVNVLRLVVPVSIAVLILGSFGLHLYGTRYATHGLTLLRLLVIGAIPCAIYTLGEALLRIQHRPVRLVLTQGGQCLLFLGLSLWLLPKHGIDGVGVAFLISQLAGASLLLATTMRPLLLSGRRAGASSLVE